MKSRKKTSSNKEKSELRNIRKSDNRFKAKKKPMRNRFEVTLLVILCLLLVGSIIMFTPPGQKITQGLDIKGGLSIVMSASHSDGSAVTNEELEQAVTTVEQRVNRLGASEATVQKQGDHQILVQIPGVEDAETALATIGTPGVLEFVNVEEIDDDEVIDRIESYETGFEIDSSAYEDAIIITGDNVKNVSVNQSQYSGEYEVDLTLDSEGTDLFADATTDLAPTNGKIAILLDGVVQSAPSVQSAILGGNVSITGGYTLEEAQSLKNILDSGSLSVQLTFSQSQVVGPTLGQDSLKQALIVAIIGLVLVMAYLIFFYRGLGLLTAGALLTFAILYLGLLALLSSAGLFSLSLSGIAGIVLTIGMAAYSSILVLERFKEEIRMGRSVRAASISGVKHGILTSIDADLVSLVSALALFFIAVGAVKGFGLTLALGIICDIIAMLLFKAPIVRLLAPKVIVNHPGFWGIKEDQKEAVEAGNVAPASAAAKEVSNG